MSLTTRALAILVVLFSLTARARADEPWTGTWHTTTAGNYQYTMTLKQSGASVTGTYISVNGGVAQPISGTVSGDKLTGTWTDGVDATGSTKNASSGPFEYTMDATRNAFTGVWGTVPGQTMTRRWGGTRVAPKAAPIPQLRLYAYAPCGDPISKVQVQQIACDAAKQSAHLVAALGTGKESLPTGTALAIEQSTDGRNWSDAGCPAVPATCRLTTGVSNLTGIYVSITGITGGVMLSYRATLRDGANVILATSESNVTINWKVTPESLPPPPASAGSAGASSPTPPGTPPTTPPGKKPPKKKWPPKKPPSKTN